MENVISAISTANGVGGVAIIRLSGENALLIASKMFKPSNKKVKVCEFEPYKLYVGEIDGGSFTDFGMAVYFKGPKSYTGEDMVEFHCHGGIAISRGILKRTLELGAVPATKGEFTKRAFLNGKLSLDSCEGLIDMINSESVAEIKAGYSLYRERLFKIINGLQEDIKNALAKIDADIDYPEEDLETLALDSVKTVLQNSYETVKQLIAGYGSGSKIKSGVKVAIVGKTNAGKSSLLNALLNYDKAIVSSIEGTTRDVVEGSIDINGVRFNLFDTAGIRETNDELEKMGIQNSQKILNIADVILNVKDLSDMSEGVSLDDVSNKEIINVYNKTDVVDKRNVNGVCISAKTGENLSELKDEMYKRAFKNGIDLNAEFITEERHFNVLQRAEKGILDALNNLGVVTLDMLADDITVIYQTLGEITGNSASEDIIDEIFSKFCVGK